MGGHHSRVPDTVNWLTPPHVIEALGGVTSFDLDPCAPFRSKIQTARRCYSWIFQDGFALPWFGRIWLNPPYSTAAIAPWLARLMHHGTGTALIFARTDTDYFHRYVFEGATAALFIRKRLNFHRLDGTRAQKNAGAPSVLIAYGMADTDRLAACGIPGGFQPLNIPRAVLVAALGRETWRGIVAEVLHRAGPVPLGELYKRLADHPKTHGRRHWRAKVRQTLQQGGFQRVATGVWAASC